MRILVVGAGAIGGFYGAHLAKAGRDVSFLVRPKRAEQLRKTDLQLKSSKGDISIRPNLVLAHQIDSAFSVILVAVKSFSFGMAMEEMAPAVGLGTVILAPLNGMKHMELLAARFGTRPILGCASKISVELDGEGRVVQTSPMEEIAYGEIDGSKSQRILALDELMQGAGFNARLSDVIARELWEKWILLSTLGGINSLLRGSVGEIAAAPGGTDFVNRLLDEIVAVVAKVGIAPSPAFVGVARNLLTAKGSPMTSSMYRDLSKGLPIEAEEIIGDLLARGRKADLSLPMLSAVYANLCVYQARLRAA